MELRTSGRLRRSVDKPDIEPFVARGDPRRGLCAPLTRRLPARVPARLLVQNALPLLEPPPEARAALRRVGRSQRTRSRWRSGRTCSRCSSC